MKNVVFANILKPFQHVLYSKNYLIETLIAPVVLRHV